AAAFPEMSHPALPGGHTITRSSSPVMECPLKFSECITGGTRNISDTPVISLFESKERCPQTQCGDKARTNTVSACWPPPAGNPPYRLPNHPSLMYISAVARPNNVLEALVVFDKPRTLISPSATMRKIQEPHESALASVLFRGHLLAGPSI